VTHHIFYLPSGGVAATPPQANHPAPSYSK